MSAPGYRTETQTFVLEPGEDEEIAIDLERTRGAPAQTRTKTQVVPVPVPVYRGYAPGVPYPRGVPRPPRFP